MRTQLMLLVGCDCCSKSHAAHLTSVGAGGGKRVPRGDDSEQVLASRLFPSRQRLDKDMKQQSVQSYLFWKPRIPPCHLIMLSVNGWSYNGSLASRLMLLPIAYLDCTTFGLTWRVLWSRLGNFSVLGDGLNPRHVLLPLQQLLWRHLSRALLSVLIWLSLSWWRWGSTVSCGQGSSLRFNIRILRLGRAVAWSKSSKTGLRHGSEEAVAIRDRLMLMLLDTLFSWQPWRPGNRIWPVFPSGLSWNFSQIFGFLSRCKPFFQTL